MLFPSALAEFTQSPLPPHMAFLPRSCRTHFNKLTSMNMASVPPYALSEGLAPSVCCCHSILNRYTLYTDTHTQIT